jgi:phenylacetate-CoA ligase
MFIVRGVNVFPSAVESIVRKHTPQTTGEFCILLESDPPQPPLKILIESAIPDQGAAWADLAASLEEAIRRDLQFTASVKLLPAGSLTASEHKTPRLFRLYRGDKPPVDIGD